MIISELNRRSGFYSQFFFTINHYIRAIKNNQGFSLISSNWLFKYREGWTDYFEPIKTNFPEDTQVTEWACHGYSLAGYKISDYRAVIPDIYRYNNTIQAAIIAAQRNFGLIPNEYGAIFIRRGDKLVHESNYTHASKYLQKLLNLYPTMEILYVQTDDYNSILELEEYIREHSLNISVLTSCPKDCRGIIIFPAHKNSLLLGSVLDGNKEYLNKCAFQNVRPVTEMNPEEVYEHTKRMLIGLELVMQARCVVTDYESNVSRFIKLRMEHDKVHSVLEKEENEPDYDKIVNPACGF